jgi:ubiquinone/menaquinone biosynthesis C-methylase UbiE
MGLYKKFFLPYLTDFAMRDKAATARRSELVPGADGIVLEIGIGSGLNLPFYSSAVRHLYAVDPSPELLAMTRKRRLSVWRSRSTFVANQRRGCSR